MKLNKDYSQLSNEELLKIFRDLCERKGITQGINLNTNISEVYLVLNNIEQLLLNRLNR